MITVSHGIVELWVDSLFPFYSDEVFSQGVYARSISKQTETWKLHYLVHFPATAIALVRNPFPHPLFPPHTRDLSLWLWTEWREGWLAGRTGPKGVWVMGQLIGRQDGKAAFLSWVSNVDWEHLPCFLIYKKQWWLLGWVPISCFWLSVMSPLTKNLSLAFFFSPPHKASIQL